MSFLSLFRGKSASLTKDNPGLKRILAGLSWDARVTDGEDFDLDLSVLMLGKNEKMRSDADFVFYNNPNSPEGSVVYSGDNRTGDGDGDDETMAVDLSRVPSEISKLLVVASIHEAAAKKQNFGMVTNAAIRIVDVDAKKEIARYDLGEDAGTETALVFGEIYRYDGEWRFKAVGQGFGGGLEALLKAYGAEVSA